MPRQTPSFRLSPLVRALVVLAVTVPLFACGGSDDAAPADKPPVVEPPAEKTPVSISLKTLGRYESGQFDASAAEIPAYDPASKRAFVVNAHLGAVDVLDLADPAKPVRVGRLDATRVAAGAEVNSVAVQDGVVALAIQAADKTDLGFVGFYKADTLAYVSHVQVGALPDMLTFTPDGKTVLVANEGEPSLDYQKDPEGSIGVIDVSDIGKPTVRLAHFRDWNGKAAELRASGVRLFGPNASVAQDMEPEYIAVSADGRTAWATLQENNALAKIDVATAKVTAILPLGFKDHGQDGNEMDVSDGDGDGNLLEIKIAKQPGVVGMYMPDAIASYAVDGKTYLVTANEGDARAWFLGEEGKPPYWRTSDADARGDATKGFVEEWRVKHLVHKDGFARRRGNDLPPQLDQFATGAMLNHEVFNWCGATAGNPRGCRDDDVLGRLTISWVNGYRLQADGVTPARFTPAGVLDNVNGTHLMYDKLYAFGGRSFSIWDEDGKQVWDSGAQFEKYLASDACKLGPSRNIPCKDYFNSGHNKANAFDDRSDAKGPEPEGVEIGRIGDKTFAFIGLERMGGVMVYDITNPRAPSFVDYYNTRADWTTKPSQATLAQLGDLGPEGLKFIPAAKSPVGRPLLIVGNEVSGTTVIFDIEQVLPTP